MVSQGYHEEALYRMTLRQLEFYCEKTTKRLKAINEKQKH
jgi:hypothetical protein